MSVKYNGTAIQKMKYNGKEVTKWVHNGKEVFASIFYFVKNGANSGNFKYTGPSTGVATITSSSVLKLEVKMTPSGMADGFNFDTDLADFTNYKKFVFNHNTTVNGGNPSAVTLKILNESNSVVYTNTYITNTNASSSRYSSTTSSTAITVDISTYKGKFKVRLDCKIYGQNEKDTIEISNCYIE